jgi:Tol biopolymer transport system component
MRSTSSVHGLVVISLILAAAGCSVEPADREAGCCLRVLEGPYLGQELPGVEPALFAEGVVSTGMSELNSVFSPDGTEFYFSIAAGDMHWVMMASYQRDGVWSRPEAVTFPGPYSAVDMAFSPDGNRLYYCSNRPPSGTGEASETVDIWFVERDADGWSEPINPGPPINSEYHEFYPSLTTDGTLYFQSRRPGGPGPGDIYRSRLVDGEYREAELLPPPVNTEDSEGDALVAPDESFIIITGRATEPLGTRDYDLFVSFRREDDSWSERTWLGDKVNSNQGENCPTLSPDGRFFFFTSRRATGTPGENESYDALHKRWNLPAFGHGHGDIYWVDAAVIETLRPS